MITRIILISFLFSFTSLKINAQEPVPVLKKNWTAYSQAINVTEEMYDSEFKVSGYIRHDSVGNNTTTALWTRVDNNGFFQNDAYNQDVTITNDWQKFEINGKIKKGAVTIYIGTYVKNNGIFYFDDFKISYKNKNRVWKNIPINNAGFESPSNQDSWNEGIRLHKKIHIENFTISYSKVNPHSGNYALRIKGHDIIGNNRKGKFANVNGVKLYYEIYGEGEPLLMIHGNGQSLSAFMNQVSVFSQFYKVILVDCRGRGNSGYNPNVELTYNLEVNDIIGLLDHLKLKKAHILGWSDGAIIGLIMAIKYPERVDNLVAMAANIFPEGLKKTTLDSFKEIISTMKKDGKAGISLNLFQLMEKYPQMNFTDLNAIKTRTLIMAGDQDVIKNSHTIKIFENINGAQLAILPNETHYLPEENPALFNQIVLNFLNSDDK